MIDAWSGSPPLLASSVNGGGLFYLSPEGSVECWSRVDTTGMAILPQDALLLARQAEGRAELRRFHSGDTHRIELVARSLDLHDLFADGDRLLLVATQINTVFEFDLDFRETRHWSFPGEEDSQHLNSVCRHGGRILASRFGQFSRSRGYSGASRGAGQMFDVETGEIVLGGLSQPHSLTPDGEELWLCDSETGRLLMVRAGQVIRERQIDGYARGIALTRNDLYVGISASRNVDDGGRTHAEILRLDRASLQERARIRLPASEIYDIVALSPKQVEPMRAAAFKDAVAEYDTQVHERNLQVAAVRADARKALRSREELHTYRQRTAFLESENVRMAADLREHALRGDRLAARLEEELDWRARLEGTVHDISGRMSVLQRSHSDVLTALRQREERIRRLYTLHEEGEHAISQRDVRIAQLQTRIASMEATRVWRWTRHLRGSASDLNVVCALPPPPVVGVEEAPHAFIAEDRPSEQMAVLSRAQLPIRRIAFRDEPVPCLSVIVAAFGGFEITRRCLESLQADGLAPPMEVIVVEDASGEEEMDRLTSVPGLRYIRNPENLGYLKSMNGALAQARGTYTCLLNNDCIVREGSLRALLRPFELFHDCGIVGARLEYPDGRMQEAGGIVWNDGSACNYGHGRIERDVSFRTLREVDYVSAAAAVLPTHLLRELGGFDERYAPAYYEDTDLAFRLRQLGYRAYYSPSAVVEHVGGATHGVEEDTGVKRHQALNRVVFESRWRETLNLEQLPPGEHPFLARNRAQRRTSVLVLDGAAPRPDRDAGSRAVWQAMQALRRLEADVRFWSHAIVQDALASDLLAAHGFELFDEARAGLAFERWWKEHAVYFDMVIVNRPSMAAAHLSTLRRHGAPLIVYYGHDIHQVRLHREAVLSRDPETEAAAERIGHIERSAWLRSDVILYPSDEETRMVASFLSKQSIPVTRALTAPLLVLDGDPRPEECKDESSPQQRRDVLFVGGFAHGPNKDGIEWFLAECWPILRSRIPEIRVVIVGADPPEHLSSRAGENVVFAHGVTEGELAWRYAEARVAIAPLRYGAGLKGKVIEAMHHGVPCVTTSIGAEGLGDARALMIADDPDTFAMQIMALWRDDEAWRSASQEGRRFVTRRFSTEASRAFWDDLLRPLRYTSVADRLEVIRRRAQPAAHVEVRR